MAPGADLDVGCGSMDCSCSLDDATFLTGYTREFPVERMFRDVRGLAIGAGTIEIQKNLIARLLDKGSK